MRTTDAYYSLGLIFFLTSAVFTNRDLVRSFSTTVFVNGVLCHGAHVLETRGRSLVWWWDVSCNAAMCAYVNWVSTAQPITCLLTTYALLCFALNRRLRDWFVHVFGVQIPLCVTLLSS